MKIYSGKVITRLNHRPLMADQEQLTDINGIPVILNGVPQMTGGREMTVGDVISSNLTTKKIDQFNTRKAYALAQRFYMADVTDLDDSDFTGLRDLVEKNDQYIPLFLAQVIQVLIEAKEKGEMKSQPAGIRTDRHRRPVPTK